MKFEPINLRYREQGTARSVRIKFERVKFESKIGQVKFETPNLIKAPEVKWSRAHLSHHRQVAA